MKWVTVQQLIYSPDHTAVRALSPGAARNDAIKYKLHYKWLLMQFHCKATGKFSPRLEWSHCQFTFNLTRAAKHFVSEPKTCLSQVFIQLVTQTPRTTSVSDQFTVYLIERMRELEEWNKNDEEKIKWNDFILWNTIPWGWTWVWDWQHVLCLCFYVCEDTFWKAGTCFEIWETALWQTSFAIVNMLVR